MFNICISIFCDFYIVKLTLYVQFIVVYNTIVLHGFIILCFTTLQFGFLCIHGTIVLYVFFIISCTMLQFRFVCSLFVLFCCSDTNTPHTCSTNGLVAPNASLRLPSLNIQCWHSRYGFLPLSVNPPAPPYTHQFNPTDQAFPSNPF